jgi:YidC/Oxa1 family membrane protein insertase
MINAEMQRVLLLVALAATAYLLILAWNDDYVRAVPTQPVATEPTESPAQAPAETGAERNGSRDVPIVKADAAANAGQSLTDKVEHGSRLIHVSTGAMSIWIDLLGGDIVRVQLPRYPVSIDQPENPYLLLDRRAGHVYIAQSGLIGRDGPDGAGQRPLYRSVRSEYDLARGGSVTLSYSSGGVAIEKVFTFTPDEYVVNLSYRIHNESAQPFEASQFAQLKRDANEVAGATSHALGPRPYLGAALTTDDERYRKLTFSDLDKGAFSQVVDGGWIAMLQHYFVSAWVAEPDQENHYYGRRQTDETYIVGYTGPTKRIEPNSTGVFSSRFYAGPKDQDRLALIAPNLNLTVDYGFLWWLADPLFHLLEWLHGLVRNWGAAIILLTLMVKLVLFPLSAASYKSMANMRRVAPQMKRLQERHADDRQKLSQEMMAFYKKEKINPLGGCLPMLLQMPVFLALYWVLFESVELRQAPFFLWIRDLSVMDPFFVLPILMGGSMFLTQALNPPVPDPMQARVMKFMPVLFTVMFLFFPAGLVLYWLVNNLLSLAQQWFITRQIEGGAKAANG